MRGMFKDKGYRFKEICCSLFVALAIFVSESPTGCFFSFYEPKKPDILKK
ncbi:AgrD family cyclic lactone autoinducer peptide [Enterococcus sp. MSG2901]|uniref:Cyclic lactone autoinducer peptide n=1 Tax=Candidatus Enterococcus courvalinii TaxID=2815329 RepID=A0ABS3HXS4_9ENTE|nr:cyclic lactone autoinducer peptide [Enterococcus sp. MSG2901]